MICSPLLSIVSQFVLFYAPLSFLHAGKSFFLPQECLGIVLALIAVQTDVEAALVAACASTLSVDGW